MNCTSQTSSVNRASIGAAALVVVAWIAAPLLALVVPLALAVPRVARADIFVLKTGGQVRGELENANQSPRTTFELRTPGGGTVTLDAKQVKKRVAQSPDEIEYDRLKLSAPDTIEGQVRMSDWCRAHDLGEQRKTHLERIIEIDPNHKQARMVLGYVFLHGQWTTKEEDRIRQGYVKAKDGTWKLPQQIAIIESERKAELAHKGWAQKLKRWRDWLDTNKADEAQKNIEAIDDPFATKAVSNNLHHETDRDVKLMYVNALTKINTPDSLTAVANAAIWDDDEEVRLSCVDKVVSKEFKPAVGMFVQSLRDKDNMIVNRAGVALGRLQDPATIGPLIDAITTSHKFEYVQPSQGNTSATFGGGNAGMSFGSPPVIKGVNVMQNTAVLTALVNITGIDLGYNPQAWKYWLAQKKKPTTLDARRD